MMSGTYLRSPDGVLIQTGKEGEAVGITLIKGGEARSVGRNWAAGNKITFGASRAPGSQMLGLADVWQRLLLANYGPDQQTVPFERFVETATGPVRASTSREDGREIITVVVQESITTKKDSSTKSDKNSSLDASLQSFLFSPGASKLLTKGGKLPAMAMSSKNGFEGKGAIANSETITHRFGVTIRDVLPNGNLMVEGLRQTTFSGESKTVILRGTLRSYDVTFDNTVLSSNLADVSIRFEDSGAISNAQKKGWFSRAWDVLTPF